ncbi:MAG TPA: hypothetical protein VEB23_10340 [Ramlibacter sp.]|nr:hypothetical protein [Ramlibacter sp.]
MNNLLTPARILMLLLLGSGPAAAQSLGAPAAEVWMGRPLEMTVPARFAAGDTGGECVHADVFYGETRVSSDRVRATVLGADAPKRVRIQAMLPVNEPVVTVSVRAGCRNTITRNYTLLPEMPTETMVAALVARQQAAAAGPAAAAPLRLATTTSPVAAAPRVAPVRTAQARGDRAAAPRARSASVIRRPAAAGPRLRLEPIELEQQAVLRASAGLAQPQGDAGQRATAALLWRAINADPQEVLRTSAMLQKLEADLLQLRQTSGQTRAELAALRQRLDAVQQQPWYASAAAMQVVALLVLAAAAAAGLVWYRGRRNAEEPWYDVPVPAADETAAAPKAVEPRELPDVTGPVPPSLPQEQRGVLPPAPLQRAGNGVLRVETLAATLEEMEFLSSLGLTKDAMDVLKAYLQDCAEPAPVAWFELMRLCQQYEDAAALATVRRRYAHTYGVDAPHPDRLAAPLGLEGMSEMSARVVAAWGRPEVLDVIQEALFKVPQPGSPMTLQAGRDLVCLHGLALHLVADDAAPHVDTGHADGHPLAPWASPEGTAAAHAPGEALVDAESGRHFALDVDLGAHPELLPEPEPEPDLEPLLQEMRTAAREAAAREAARKAQDEDAFSAAVASERVPVSRF